MNEKRQIIGFSFFVVISIIIYSYLLTPVQIHITETGYCDRAYGEYVLYEIEWYGAILSHIFEYKIGKWESTKYVNESVLKTQSYYQFNSDTTIWADVSVNFYPKFRTNHEYINKRGFYNYQGMDIKLELAFYTTRWNSLLYNLGIKESEGEFVSKMAMQKLCKENFSTSLICSSQATKSITFKFVPGR